MPLESKASMHASGIKQICFVNNNVNMLRDFIVFSALIKIYRCRNTVDPQSLFSKGVLIFSFFSLEFSFFRSSRGWGGSLVAPLALRRSCPRKASPCEDGQRLSSKHLLKRLFVPLFHEFIFSDFMHSSHHCLLFFHFRRPVQNVESVAQHRRSCASARHS